MCKQDALPARGLEKGQSWISGSAVETSCPWVPAGVPGSVGPLGSSEAFGSLRIFLRPRCATCGSVAGRFVLLLPFPRREYVVVLVVLRVSTTARGGLVLEKIGIGVRTYF